MHDTPLRKLNGAPAGLGVSWIVHRVPFHRSAKPPVSDAPEASQAPGAVQETPVRTLKNCAPEGFGVCWTAQVLPFHRSANVTSAPEPVTESPTATHEFAPVQVTAFSSAACVPGGTGANWTRHLEPPHCSTRSFEFALPTAVQVSAAGHATADSLLGDPPGLGVRWMRQLLPFHRSARAWETPPMMACPTAVQADGVLQATPFRALTVALAGLGVGRMRHEVPSHRSASVTPAPEALT